MKFYRTVFASFFALSLLAAGAPAKADPKPTVFSWHQDHWYLPELFHPYTDDPVQTQNTQWDKSKWEPEHWVRQRGGDGPELMRELYVADIVREQDTRDGMPSVTVGPGFYTLGGEDKRRVAQTIDYVYGITQNDVYGSFILYDWRTDMPIGTYNQFGLQMN